MYICVDIHKFTCFYRELKFYFLFRYVLNESQSRQNSSSSSQGSSSNSGGGSGIPQPPPGMSFYAAKRVIGDNPWTPEQLEQVSSQLLFIGVLTLNSCPCEVHGSMCRAIPVISSSLKSMLERSKFFSSVIYLLKP
jgi:hypothetical protein